MTYYKQLDTFLFIIESKALVVCYIKDNTCFGNVVLTCYFKHFKIEITTDRDVGRISFSESPNGNSKEYSWETIYKEITPEKKEIAYKFEEKINWTRDNIDSIIAYFVKKSKEQVISASYLSERINEFLRKIRDFKFR